MQLKSVDVDIFEETITLNMNDVKDAPQGLYQFATTRKEDIANLIASYSPAHRTWRQVGMPTAHKHKATEEERIRVLEEIKVARKKLVESGILRTPPETKSGLLVTTLRRYSSKSKVGKFVKGDHQDYEDIYDAKFWSYSKVKYPQPLTQVCSLISSVSLFSRSSYLFETLQNCL
jgi:hypothetical protein